MRNSLNLERIAIDVTTKKISYLEAINGIVKTPTSLFDIKEFNEQDQIIINAAINIIVAKSKEQKEEEKK